MLLPLRLESLYQYSKKLCLKKPAIWIGLLIDQISLKNLLLLLIIFGCGF